jgi:hypothetical protein
MAEPAKRDPKAPMFLNLNVVDNNGKSWGVLTGTPKDFSSGAVGFYANGKIVNPESAERYQCGCNITLIGSKPT